MRSFAAIGIAVALGTIGASTRASAQRPCDAHRVSANSAGFFEPTCGPVRDVVRMSSLR